MSNLHDSNTEFNLNYSDRRIPLAFLGLLQVLAGSVLMRIGLADGDVSGLLCAAALIAVGTLVLYISRSGSRHTSIGGRLLLKDDRIIMQTELDGIQTVFWSSVKKIRVDQGGLNRRIFGKITIVYQDHTCGLLKDEKGQELFEVKTLELPLALFKRSGQITQRIKLIARELQIPLEIAPPV